MLKSPLLVMGVTLICCHGCSTYPLLSDVMIKPSDAFKPTALTLGLNQKACVWGLLETECLPLFASPVIERYATRSNKPSPFLESLLSKRGTTKTRLRLRRNRVELVYKF